MILFSLNNDNMKHFLILFSVFIFGSFYGQQSHLYISLEISGSITLNSDIKIEISNSEIEGNTILKITRYSDKENKDITEKTIINKKAYNEIYKNATSIKLKDILKHDELTVIDGYSMKLTLKPEIWKQVEYYLTGYHFDVARSPSKEFSRTVISILKYAKMTYMELINSDNEILH